MREEKEGRRRKREMRDERWQTRRRGWERGKSNEI